MVMVLALALWLLARCVGTGGLQEEAARQRSRRALVDEEGDA